MLRSVRSFVEGRTKGRPNVSHGWARTVDGCQGGTWIQVHLLGSAALNRYSGLVGQSRSQLPTHTWNVTRIVDVDHGGALADDRTPGEEVLDALRREPDTAFAVHADPYQLDRQLTAERHEHLAVLARRPPGDSIETWERLHGWRRQRIDEIDTTLPRHWADAVLITARQGEPLAYGLDRLRAARGFTAHQLEIVNASIPPDRSEALLHAERDLARQQEILRYTRRQAHIAHARLETTKPRRFGRSDHFAMDTARLAADEASETARQAALRVEKTVDIVETERCAVSDRNTIIELTRDSRRQLNDDLHLLNTSLDDARHNRIRAAVHDRPEGAHLRALLGSPPRQQAALGVWCAVADIVESHHDRPPEEGASADRQAQIQDLIDQLPALMANAQHLGPATGTIASNPAIERKTGHGLEF